jgi:hypothetical protein
MPVEGGAFDAAPVNGIFNLNPGTQIDFPRTRKGTPAPWISSLPPSRFL